MRARDVKTELDELYMHLQHASRINPDSPSNRELRKMLRRPSVLDALEQAVSVLWAVEKGLKVSLRAD